MKTKILCIIALVGLIFTSCEHDNYGEPNAILSGKVVYNGNPVGVRTDAARFELWQEGYVDKLKIEVNIAYDGTYSAALFNGRYKLVRSAGAPWIAQPADTIFIDVKGNTTQNVEVTPYMVIGNETIAKGTGNTVQAKFTVNRVVDSSRLEEVKLFFSKNLLLDNNLNNGSQSVDISTITLGSETTMAAHIPDALASENYIFVKLGVRTDKSNEFYYTQVQKIQLK